MDCSRFREAMSAALDGEDPGLPQAEVTAHVRSCPTCARWHDQAVALDRRVRIRESDLVPDLVQHRGTECPGEWRAQPHHDPWRLKLSLTVGIPHSALCLVAVRRLSRQSVSEPLIPDHRHERLLLGCEPFHC